MDISNYAVDDDMMELANGVTRLITPLLAETFEGKRKFAIALSSVTPGLFGLSSMLGNVGYTGAGLPTKDHVLLACLFLARSISVVGETTSGNVGLGIDLSLSHITEAIEDFKKLTGREIKPMVSELVLRAIEAEAKQRSGEIPDDVVITNRRYLN